MYYIFQWKKPLIQMIISVFLIVASGLVLADSDDVKGSSDHPLFTRMPGYHIDDYDDKDFDSLSMPGGPDGKDVTVEGHCTIIHYRVNDGAKRASEAQIKRNYANAIQKIGGKKIYEDYVCETLKITKNNAEIWALIESRDEGDWYRLTVVTKEVMKQDVVADAASLANSLKDTGKVALYGIYFDTGKAIVKPESQPALQEIAKLLKNDPKLKLHVVGHTDNTGTLDANMKLSMDRAAAVVKVLVTQYGISAVRLTACGDGPTAPVASNDTEEGRAKNRRVELVKQSG
jgi:outer membrane protein OmpA-like peptidoglycan-associated protein